MEMVVILHNIRSLANVGSIFRTADGVGAKKLYLVGLTPTPLDIFDEPRLPLTKISLGAEKFVPWEYIKGARLKPLIADLKKDCYKIVALELSDRAIPYYKWRIPKNKKIAIILGHETRGIPAGILDQSDAILEIPMSGGKESLNVAMAFGIAAFHMRDSS